MSENVQSVLDQAMQLPERGRAEVAARLLDSLDATVDPDVESAWVEEIRQRLDDVRSGREQAIPWAEARRQILEDGDDAG